MSDIEDLREKEQDVLSLLLKCLDDLVSEQLERFHSYLSHEPPQEYNSIPRSHLEKLNRTTTVDKMLEHYGREGAVKVTLYILEKMDLNEQAASLRRRMESMAITDSQPHPSSAVIPDASLRAVQEKLKSKLKKKCERICEGVTKQGRSALLIKVYTEVFITEGECGHVNNEHEVWNIEAVSKNTLAEEMRVECNKIFQPLPGEEERVRSVLTKGIAGIGKTVSVQKFILDWVEGKANRDINLIFPLPFRELNLMKDRKISLLGLIQHYHPELKLCKTVDLNSSSVLFIFDGLDECRLPLNFDDNETWYEETEALSVDVLLTNLIQGNILPSSLLWITSRPAAANRIPHECIQRVTEVRGFNDPQKEEYFRKRFTNQELASKIISHIKSSRSLHIMCHIPVFCWISATVLERLLDKSEGGQIPKTLTQMYTQFLCIQILMKNQKYYRNKETNTKKMQETDGEITVNLGKLAFQNLEKNNLIFNEQDLKDSGIDASKAPEYSGLYTEMFKEEFGLYEDKTYCFVHLSIQEYLAALSVHFLYANNKKENPLNLDKSKYTNPDGGINLSAVHRSAVDKALQSPNGHLDLFLRFLLGISLDSQALSGLLPLTGSSSQNVMETIKYIKEKISNSKSPERTINLFHCLSELNDDSLVQEIQSYVESNSLSYQKLSPDQCSALAYMLVMSEKQVDVLDLKKYNTTQAGYRRLLPVLKHTRAALLHFCDLTPALCSLVILVLESPTSLLRELDLGYNRKLGDKGVKLLCAGLQTPHCRLQTLGLGDCSLTKGCCEDLALVLSSRHSELRELDLRSNDLLDCGVTALSAGLEDPLCKLEKLGLSGCGVTERGCHPLASALQSKPSHLIELDLSYNHPGDIGVKALSARLEDPSCTLEKLILDHGGECRIKLGMHKYDCHLTLDPSTATPNVVLSEGNRKAFKNYDGNYTSPVLCKEPLTDRYYWEVEWASGTLEVGVAYQIPPNDCVNLGNDDQSWAIRSDPETFRAFHNDKVTHLMTHHPQAKYRVGVYLDWPTGILAFYNISSKGPIHLHTFHATFTKPLYPAFALSMDVPMTLC